jgi:hypothetical protein
MCVAPSTVAVGNNYFSAIYGLIYYTQSSCFYYFSC